MLFYYLNLFFTIMVISSEPPPPACVIMFRVLEKGREVRVHCCICMWMKVTNNPVVPARAISEKFFLPSCLMRFPWILQSEEK